MKNRTLVWGSLTLAPLKAHARVPNYITRIVSACGARMRALDVCAVYVYIYIREIPPFNSLVWDELTLAPIRRLVYSDTGYLAR